MNPNETLRLLILNDSQSEAERLISMLNNAGRSVRAQYVEAEDILVKLLQDQVWDLLICHRQTTKLPPQTAIQQIRRHGKDIPVILQTDDEGSPPVVEGLKMGAADVVRLDEDQHLLLVINRELSNREQRQLRRQADRRLKEAERRSQSLLDSSRHAIAFTQDGLFLYANQSFAERFGHASADDLECMPVIDMVAENDQSLVKAFFKEFALKGNDTEEDTELAFHALDASGNSIPVKVSVTNAIYDEEPCIRFYIAANQDAENEVLSSALEDMKDRDPTSGLFNRKYLIDELDKSLDAAANRQVQSALLHVVMEQLEETVQSMLGLTAIDKVVRQVALQLEQTLSAQHTIAKFSDDTYEVLISDITAEAAIEQARALASALSEMIIEVDQKTLQLTPVIGVALVNETSNGAQDVLNEALEATAAAAKLATPELRVALYEPPLGDFDMAEKDITKAVKSALENNRFRLMFQPVISLRGSEEELYEVFLRMIDDDGNEIYPAKFFEAAERNGISTKIDRWVILEAVKVLAEHRAKGNPTRLLINLGRHSMCDEALPAWIGVVFKAAGLSPDTVIFQCKEVDITNHLNAAKTFFTALQKMHANCGISSFGCSLTPFNTLKHVPNSYIKVDGSFTQDIQNNNEGTEALKQLLAELHQAEKVTIVPYVEQATVLSTLWQAGAHYIQGHYLQGPSAEMSYEFSSEG